MSDEVWRDVSGYNGIYQVSDKSRVRRTRGRQGKRIVTQWARDGGYMLVRLTAAELEKREVVSVHRLVAIAFVPNPDGLPVVNHLDFNTKNNYPSNLEWCTQSDNIKYSRDLGRYKDNYWNGKRSPAALLSEEKVCEVRKLRVAGLSQQKIADNVGCSKRTVQRILKGESYAPLPQPPSKGA